MISLPYVTERRHSGSMRSIEFLVVYTFDLCYQNIQTCLSSGERLLPPTCEDPLNRVIQQERREETKKQNSITETEPQLEDRKIILQEKNRNIQYNYSFRMNFSNILSL